VARYHGPVCRLCRREGEKLFLKGPRCYTEKCAVERREYPPGQHGQARPRTSEYAAQLREKQKIKRIYGVQERQFRNYFAKAERKKGITGEHLILMLESRLDNVVYRLGFSASRKQSRLLIRQDHFLVNGKKVNIPSIAIGLNDVIQVKEQSRGMIAIQSSLEAMRIVPDWLELERAPFKGTVRLLPTREQVAAEFNEQMVVELYSR
jgi:small subunit ribosomal protein S4